MTELDDAVAFVRANPARFLRNGTFHDIELATELVREALLSGSSPVAVVRLEGWTIVHSPQDWLGPDATAAFRRIVPFPEGGQNAMRAEILATAFASEVLTKLDGQVHRITGTGPPPAMADLANRGRAVAFR